MYIPSYSRVTDEYFIDQLLTENPLATMISVRESVPDVSHIPLVWNRSNRVFQGHFARANPHAQILLKQKPQHLTLVFHGPNAYISPMWYVDSAEVPTWNYAVVHVTASYRMIEDAAELIQCLRSAVETFESPLLVPHGSSQRHKQWPMETHSELVHDLLNSIVGIEITPITIECKVKAGQNRTVEDRHGAAAALSEISHNKQLVMDRIMRDPPRG